MIINDIFKTYTVLQSGNNIDTSNTIDRNRHN